MAEPLDRVDALAATAARVVQNKTKDRRIIVLYPRHRQHTTLISLLHKFYADRMYFYALTEYEDKDLENFIRNVSHDAMFPIDFGEQVRVALRTSNLPSDWGEAFAADLIDLHRDSHHIMLLFDNFDLLPYDNARLYQFFGSLARHLPNHIQVIINGGELRRHPWLELQNEGLAISLGDDETFGTGIFEEPDLRGQLEVYALSGGSQVIIDGRPITAWEGSLPRDLFFFFVDKPMVTRSEIFEAFWPNMETREATNVFHVTKRKISEKLGYDLTSYENGFYIPNTRLNRLYDVSVFEEYVNKALHAANPIEEEDNWFHAVQIYRGQFLKEVDKPWAAQRRQQLRDTYTQALMSLARIYREQGKMERALSYVVRASGERPDREDVYRQLMELYMESDRADEAKWAYLTLENNLQERFNIQPSSVTRSLYEQLVS